MEHLYIIATSEDGPCKIGRSRPDIRRLPALQSGNPQPLEQYETFPLRSNSSLAERLAHWVMEDYKCRDVPKQREWFNVTVRQAAYVLKDIVRSIRAVDQDDVIVNRATLQYVGDSNAESQEYWDWHDENNGGDCPDFELPGPYLIKALTEEPAQKHRFTFREWLATVPEGYPFLDMEVEDYETRPRSNFNDLKSLLPTIRYLKKKGAGQGLYFSEAWLSWCYGRDTERLENEMLAAVWNQFAPHWNRVNDNGFGISEKGVDDTVNGVRFFGIPPNERWGHGSYLYFNHVDFSVILRLPRGATPFDEEVRSWEKLKEVSLSDLKGFITPNLSRIWDNPFDRHVRRTRERLNLAFAEFIARESHEFSDPCRSKKHIIQDNQGQVLLTIGDPFLVGLH